MKGHPSLTPPRPAPVRRPAGRSAILRVRPPAPRDRLVAGLRRHLSHALRPQCGSRRIRPQASVEFDLDGPEAVTSAARELERSGYDLLHRPRTEPWAKRSRGSSQLKA